MVGGFSLDNPVFSIQKKCLWNFDPLKPHFYIEKMGFAGVYIIFLISAIKHKLGTRQNRIDEVVLKSTHNLCFNLVLLLLVTWHLYPSIQNLQLLP